METLASRLSTTTIATTPPADTFRRTLITNSPLTLTRTPIPTLTPSPPSPLTSSTLLDTESSAQSGLYSTPSLFDSSYLEQSNIMPFIPNDTNTTTLSAPDTTTPSALDTTTFSAPNTTAWTAQSTAISLDDESQCPASPATTDDSGTVEFPRVPHPPPPPPNQHQHHRHHHHHRQIHYKRRRINL